MYDTPRHHRRSIRLRGYDYARAGVYFVTVCTRRAAHLFGDVVDGVMHLNEAGRIIQMVWDELPTHYPNVSLDAFVVMPNHIHGIIAVHRDTVGAIHELPQCIPSLSPVDTRTARRRMLVPMVVGRLKMMSSKCINAQRSTPGHPVWQRNYYEQIIRNANALARVRRYIADNPRQWAIDPENR